MLRFCLLMLLAGAGCVATAQTFKPGAIRLKGEQEQSGLIGDLKPGIPDGIEFKTDKDSPTQLYYADAIDGYSVDDNTFTSFHNSTSDKDWNFVEVLADGQMQLITKNGMFFLREKNSTRLIHLTAKYKIVLRKVTSGCPYLSIRAGGIRLNRAELTEFITAYNQCVVSDNSSYEGLPRAVSIGVMAGGDYTGIGHFEYTPGAVFLAATKHRDRSLFQGGIDLTLRAHKITSIVGFYTGVMWNFNSYSGTDLWTPDAHGLNPEVNRYSFSYKELRIPLGFEFSRPQRGRLSGHIRVGIILPKQLSFKSDHVYSAVYVTSDEGEHSVYYQEASKLKSYEPKIMYGGGAGLDYRIFGKSRIRVQANAYFGTVTATTLMSGSAQPSQGRLFSLSLMTGFIF